MGVRVLALTGLLVLALLLKTIVLPTFAIAGLRPDTVVLVVVGVGLLEGPDSGLRLGFAAGLLQDLLSGGDALVGLGAIVLLAVGYAAGLARPYIASTQQAGAVVLAGVLAAGATLGYGILGKVFAVIGAPWGRVVTATVVVGLYTAAVSPVLLRPIQSVMRQFPPPSAGG